MARKPYIMPAGDPNKVALIQQALNQIGTEGTPRAGGGTRTSRGGRRNNATQKYARQNRKAMLKKKKSSGGGGDILGDIGSAVGSALEAVDVPRSVVQSTLADTAEAAATGDIGDVAGTLNPVNLLRKTAVGVGKATGVDVGGAQDLYYKKRHAKDLIEHTGAGTYFQRALKDAGLEDTWLNNAWVKRGVGFAGDVASDPLSYVGPAHALEGGYKALAMTAEHAPEAALKAGEQAARVGVSDATRSAAERIAEQAAKRGDSALEAKARALLNRTHNPKPFEQRGVGAQAHNAARREGQRLGAKIVEKRSVSGLSADEIKRVFGTTSGVKMTLPGTGRVMGRVTGATPKQFTVLPKSVTDVLGTPLRGAKNAVADSKLGKVVGSKLSGTNGAKLNEMLRSGDPKKIAMALEFETAARTASSKAEAGLRLQPDAQINGETLNAHPRFGKGQAVGLGPRAMDVYTHQIKPLLKGKDPVEVIHAIESGNLDGIEGAQAIKDFLHELRRTAEANGVPIAERQNYFPRWLTEEAKAARGGVGSDVGRGGKMTAEQARNNEIIAAARNEANPGAAPISATDEPAIRNAVEDWARVNLPDLPNGYYEKNPDKILPHYVEALTDRVKTQDIVNRMQEQGFVIPDWMQKGGTLSKKAQKAADAALKAANEAKAKGDDRAAAAEEAAASAKLMNAVADTTEAEAKTAAQRKAAAESDAAFATLGGKDAAVRGAAVDVPPADDPRWQDPNFVDSLIGGPIGHKPDGSLGEATPGALDIQQTAQEQAAEQARLADIAAREARGEVVNPEAAARAAQAGIPPEVFALGEAAANAPAAKQAEAMQAFQDALDKHGIDVNDALDQIAQAHVDSGAVDQGVSPLGVPTGAKTRAGKVKGGAMPNGGTTGPVSAADLEAQLKAARDAGGGQLTPEQLDQFRQTFIDSYNQTVEGGLGVKRKGGRLSNAERTRREAAKLNGEVQKMDQVVEAVGGTAASKAQANRVGRNLRGLAADKSGALNHVVGDIPPDEAARMDANAVAGAQLEGFTPSEPPRVGQHQVVESPVEKALRERNAQLPPDTGAMQTPIPPGHERLYRGENAGNPGGTQFTTDLNYAKTQAGADGRVLEVDVPKGKLADWHQGPGENYGNGTTYIVPSDVASQARQSLHTGAPAYDLTTQPGETMQSVLDQITGQQPAAAQSTTSVEAFDAGHIDAMTKAQDLHRVANNRANRLTKQVKRLSADKQFAEATRLEQKFPDVQWNQQAQRFDARSPRDVLEADNFKQARKAARGKQQVSAAVDQVAPPEAAAGDLSMPGGPDYSREAADLAQYRADAKAGVADPEIKAKLQGQDINNVVHEGKAAQDTLKVRQAAVQAAIDAGAPDDVIHNALTNLAADVASATQRVADGIAPLRHASAFSGAEVIEPVTATMKDAARDNALGDLYRSQRLPSAQATADEATGVYSQEAHALTQYEADAAAGVAGGGANDPMAYMGQGPAEGPFTGGPASAGSPPPNDPFHNDANAGIAGGGGMGNPPGPPTSPQIFPSGNDPWQYQGMGQTPPQPGADSVLQAANMQESAQLDRRSFTAGLEDAKAKLKQAQDRGWDTSVHEKRIAIYEQALHEADPMRARALQFQADALSAQSQADKLWTQAAINRVTSERLRTPQAVGAFHSEINKAMSRLRVDPTLAAPNDLADILNGMSKVNTPEGVRKFLHHYDQALNYIKAWQIATPGFHLRNFMGGMFNNYLAGVDLNSYSRFWRDRNAFLNGKLTSGPRYDAMKELLPHVGSAQYSAFEVGGMETRTLAQRINPLSKNNAWLTANRKAGGSVEEMLRGALGYDRLLKGKNIDEAVGDIMRYHFDYQDLSRFERQGVKRVIPFYTWTRHNLPLQMEMYVQAPGKYARYWQAKQEIEMGQHPEGVVPSYFLNEGFGIHTPFNFGGGDVYLTPDLPFTTTVQQALPDLSGVNPGSPGTYVSALDGYASMATPLLKTPIERMQNRQFFKGIPFQDKQADMPTAWKAIPGLEPALSAVGLAKNGKISDRDAYTIEQYLPMLGRMRRLGGGAKKDNERIVSSWMSFMGLPLKTNTPYEQQLERFRRKLHTGGPKQNPYARKKY